MREPLLYSYCVRHDDGAAPNPFWGVCTLVICKPDIRRTAQVGDWVVGTGSVNAPDGKGGLRDLSGRLVYAMRVTNKLPMADYDKHCRKKLRGKIPDWDSKKQKKRVGDCIYDFGGRTVKMRPGVHGPENMAKDLRGKFALLSTDFYYFGCKPILLPASLRGIVKDTQGHRNHENAEYFERFVTWIRKQKKGVNADPQMWTDAAFESCGRRRAEDDDDERLGGCDKAEEGKARISRVTRSRGNC